MKQSYLQDLMNNASYRIRNNKRATISLDHKNYETNNDYSFVNNRPLIKKSDPDLKEQSPSKFRLFRYFAKGLNGKLEDITSGPKSLSYNQRKNDLFMDNTSDYTSLDYKSSIEESLTEEKMEIILEDQIFSVME